MGVEMQQNIKFHRFFYLFFVTRLQLDCCKVSKSLNVFVPIILFLGFDCTVSLKEEIENDRCEMMMKKIDSDDKGIITDNTPSRLHSTWISQE